jgi:hypothetical protein
LACEGLIYVLCLNCIRLQFLTIFPRFPPHIDKIAVRVFVRGHPTVHCFLVENFYINLVPMYSNPPCAIEGYMHIDGDTLYESGGGGHLSM